MLSLCLEFFGSAISIVIFCSEAVVSRNMQRWLCSSWGSICPAFCSGGFGYMLAC